MYKVHSIIFKTKRHETLRWKSDHAFTRSQLNWKGIQNVIKNTGWEIDWRNYGLYWAQYWVETREALWEKEKGEWTNEAILLL